MLGNFIGVNYTGTGVLGNSGNGIEIAGSHNTVGGTAAGAGNVISGNSKDGVLMDDIAGVDLVLGNYIGTDRTGSKPLANNIGVELDGTDNTVGGTASGAGNLISGNRTDGVLFSGSFNFSGSDNQVLGNLIGVALGGTAALADGTGIDVQ